MHTNQIFRFTSTIIVLLLLAGCGGGGGGSFSVTVSSSMGDTLLAGETTEFVITPDSATPFSVRIEIARNGDTPTILYDFTGQEVFSWATLDEGTYEVTVSVRNLTNGAITEHDLDVVVMSVPTPGPTVAATDHPLIAHYAVPAQAGPGFARILFREVGTTPFSSTVIKATSDTTPTHFYVAGMKAVTSYEMQHEILSTSKQPQTRGALMVFNTGPVDIQTPDFSVISAASMDTSIDEPFLLLNPIFGSEEAPRFPFAVDLEGNIVWYVEHLLEIPQSRINRTISGGHFLVVENGFIREIDVAGNTIRETNTHHINDQLINLGELPVLGIHHEIRRMPNGHYVTLGYIEALFDNIPGETGTVDILADSVIVLDENFQVVWVWDAFDHLDVNRVALLGEVCEVGGGGCPQNLVLADEANDWMHSNAVDYSPTDGNLIVSVRHQDWIIKIAYEDGAGDGHIVWRLGEGGDFTLSAADPHPWFSHSHDPNYISDNRIVVFDNGNTRNALHDDGFSRGQVYELDEINMTATLVHNFDLGNYSPALGSAQQLSNGNFYFNSGFHVPPPQTATADEVLPDGTLDHGIFVDGPVYRSFRLEDMYTAPHSWME